ncbi:unnamed protein product [Adineta ricciae]|uniref:Uncharacterized protein n=1 Tax=Adineta ricciae TaxID=249248 RepID=A0A816GGN1_ADIRI|nr:unnamed protein product [Adineta ricciae]CAF1674056.1 unnamed protein product [Adineta ricciae]
MKNCYRRVDELLELTKQRFDLAHQLNTMKESAGAVIRCLNISLKSSCHLIARTIIEMITHGQFQAICTNIELLMERFRREKHYPNHGWTTSNLIEDAQKRKFWGTLSNEEHEDAGLVLKWNRQRGKKNFIPINDLLKRMWSRSESTTMVTTLMSTKFGLLTDTNENIEVSVEKKRKNDINGNTFRKADAIALANFYCIALPNMKYEIIASLVHLPENSSYWFTDVQNSLNLTTATTTENDDKFLKKRKLEARDQENDIQ